MKETRLICEFFSSKHLQHLQLGCGEITKTICHDSFFVWKTCVYIYFIKFIQQNLKKKNVFIVDEIGPKYGWTFKVKLEAKILQKHS